jgi:hypothetical protein
MINVQVISLDHKPLTTAKDFMHCLFIVCDNNEAKAIRFTNDDLSDFIRVDGHSWFDQAMQISNEKSIIQDTGFYTQMYFACKQAFKNRVSSLRPSQGWSLESCASFSEDGLSPRDEAIIGRFYISIFCDENAQDDENYIVSMTPFKCGLDRFDYNKVESTHFTQYAWLENENDAQNRFKQFCMKALETI